MAQLLTDVDGLVGSTRQGFVAGLATGRDGVRAAAALGVAQLQELGQDRLPTGATPHQPGGAWARLARPTVAHLLASVGLTIQHLATCFLTGEVS